MQSIVNRNWYSNWRVWPLGFVLALVTGCSNSSDQAFTVREEVTQLPAKHQKQIGDFLHAYYGTALLPRQMKPKIADGAEEGTPPILEDSIERSELQKGRLVYLEQCAACHGVTGDGKGPAAPYLDPPPRDYRAGKFKFGSTPRGSKPRHEDLIRIVRRGAKGTSMPSFRWMPDDEANAVVAYVILLSSRGEVELGLARESENSLDEADDFPADIAASHVQRVAEDWDAAGSKVVLPMTPATRSSPESIERGARAFVEFSCFKCHGKDGRGNKAADVGKDDWGRIAFAADLTTGTLHGGRRPIDIYRRIYSGINGTPMPAFNQPDAAKGETDVQRSEKIWDLVHFITSIVEGRELPTELIDEAVKVQLEREAAGAAAPAEGTPAEGTPPAEGTAPAEEAKPETPAEPAKEPEPAKEAAPAAGAAPAEAPAADAGSK